MTRLSPGTLILGIFAVLFGLVGAYAVKQHLARPPVAQAKKPVTTVVPMAAADLKPGRTLTLGDVILVPMSPEDIKRKRLPSMFMTNPKQVIGRTLREAVAKHDSFVPTSFYPEGMGPSVAERLKPGYRAVTIPLENKAAELALVSPGMIADIVFRTSDTATRNNPTMKNIPETTVMLLEGVEVLAIGQEIFQGARPAHMAGASAGQPVATVTLAVKPNQASALKTVEGRGSMSLVLRGPDDKEPSDAKSPQTLASLLNLPEPPAPFATEIYRRGTLTMSKFENGQHTASSQSVAGLPLAANNAATPVVPVSHKPDGASADPSKPCPTCESKKQAKK